jgi:integrase
VHAPAKGAAKQLAIVSFPSCEWHSISVGNARLPRSHEFRIFPIVAEANARQSFLTDHQYENVRDVLPDYLKPLFVTAYCTGVRLGEVLAIEFDQIDWEKGFATLKADETKSGHSRAVPILDGDMRTWLEWSRNNANGAMHVFHNDDERIKDFRTASTVGWKSKPNSVFV